MKTEILSIVYLSVAFLGLFMVAEFLYHRWKLPAESSRKFVHIGTGLITLSFPFLIADLPGVFLLCLAFGILLYCSIRFNLLASIHRIDRKSYGSLAYPAAVFLCFYVYVLMGRELIWYYLPILILAISDPVAALSGRRWPMGVFHVLGSKKTLLGSGMFFLSSLLISVCLFGAFSETGFLTPSLYSILLIATLATLAEACSWDGWDNVMIPLAVLSGLYFS